MDIKGTATQAFSEAFRQASALGQKYYLAFVIPGTLGLIWGIVSRRFLYGGIMKLMTSLMVKNPDATTMTDLRHLILVLMLTMAISVLLWMIAFAGAGLIMKNRSTADFKLGFDEVLSYTGDRLSPLVTGGIRYVLLPALPTVLPAIGFLYIIGFLIYILFIGKNYGGFFFWAYPVITEGTSAEEGFARAKQAALAKKGPFWTALILGFIMIWVVNMFLAFLPYLGYILIWVLNLLFLVFTGILYYDYSGDDGQRQITAPPQG
jgi:hypothetical protein